jgi:hypothetical protein
MTWLLYARFVFLAALLTATACVVWVELTNREGR